MRAFILAILIGVPSLFLEPASAEIVKLIYFRPTDRASRNGINDIIDTMIKDVQQFYANQMDRHGFGRKTFTFETDASGDASIYHVDGQFAEAHYYDDGFNKIRKELQAQFDLSSNIHFIILEASNEMTYSICGFSSRIARGKSREMTVSDKGATTIIATTDSCFYTFVAAHELGHAFGLQHDFRDNNIYVMSYGGEFWDQKKTRISKCAAGWLNMSHYFNPTMEIADRVHASDTAGDFLDERVENQVAIQMLAPVAYPSNAIRISFEFTDANLFSQAQLIIPATDTPVGGVKLHSCNPLGSVDSLNGEAGRIDFFVSDSTYVANHEIALQVIDTTGGITTWRNRINAVDILQQQPDVNGDGVVNIFDLVSVANTLGETNDATDVNRDGAINVLDLISVANAMQ